VDDKKISKLHKEYLKIEGPTDVIAFNNCESGQIRADIAISADTAVSNAKLYKTSPFREIVLYVIHGTLQICGYDDNSRKNRLLMRKKEERLSAGILSF
jgi:rRNA maturation RNase YbeY